MFLSLAAQKVVYNKSGVKNRYTSEDIDIVFSNSTVDFPKKESFIATLAPMLVDGIFKATTAILERRVKRFTAEYSKKKSNLNVGTAKVPNFTFIRTLELEGQGTVDALEIAVVAFQVGSIGFVYEVKSIKLNYAAARTKRKSRCFDYTIEIKLSYSVDGEAKLLELAPLVISSVPFERTADFEAHKHRTEIIPLNQNAFITDVSLKIVETNPAKVRAEKILAIWNERKADAQTIINNYLPKDKKTDGAGGGDAGSGSK